MSFHDLSVELCTIIMHELACQGNLKTLSSLSQVSRSLHYLGNPILYKWNIKHQECSGFERAVFGDRVDMLKKFLEYGAPVNYLLSYNEYGRVTPLWLAAKRGSVEVVRHFFTVPGIDWNWGNRFDETPLHTAIQWGHRELALLLLTHPEISVTAENVGGWTAFVFAVAEGEDELVEKMLAMGSVNPDHRTHTGRSPLFIASDWGRSAGVVKLLLDTGRVDVNLVPNETPVTPLIAAIIADRPEIIKLLVHHPDIDVNFAPDGSAAPISIAAAEGNLEAVQILLEHPDTDPDDADDAYETPILRAAEWDHDEIVSALLADNRVGWESRQLLALLQEDVSYFEMDSESDAYSE
ncbi:ankyrin repeat-containing domain protein [Trichoderma chlorosporum]